MKLRILALFLLLGLLGACAPMVPNYGWLPPGATLANCKYGQLGSCDVVPAPPGTASAPGYYAPAPVYYEPMVPVHPALYPQPYFYGPQGGNSFFFSYQRR